MASDLKIALNKNINFSDISTSMSADEKHSLNQVNFTLVEVNCGIEYGQAINGIDSRKELFGAE